MVDALMYPVILTSSIACQTCSECSTKGLRFRKTSSATFVSNKTFTGHTFPCDTLLATARLLHRMVGFARCPQAPRLCEGSCAEDVGLPPAARACRGCHAPGQSA